MILQRFASSPFQHALIDKASGWLACGPVVVAALIGAPLTTVEAVFRMNGSDGASTDVIDLALALSYFGMGLTPGSVSDRGAEPPLWWSGSLTKRSTIPNRRMSTVAGLRAAAAAPA